MRRFLHILLIALVATLTAAPLRAAEAKKPAAPSTVAIFDLKQPIAESAAEELPIFGPPPATLRDLVKRINAAARDENVKAVVIMAEDVQAGLGQIEELRQAIANVRAKEKDVFVHSDSMGMGEYVLFSGASRISVSPTSDIWVNGLHGEQPYLRGLLNKIGVQPDFEHIGAYKSASELFMREGPSEEADKMVNWLLDSIFATQVELIATGRKVEPAKAKQWIDEGPYIADKAKSAGLIDAVEHRQEFDAMIKKKFGQDVTYERRYGTEEKEKIDFSNPFAFMKIFAEILGGKQKEESTKPAVGVVYVEGMILPGSGHDSIFGGGGAAYSSAIRKALDEAARDEKIKAVVLRVDSPGGSAVASEIILDATRRLKEKKPLVVSMGNVAGSGGYYVTCAADTIFADRATITASIGVVGGKLVTNGMWNKIGITFKSYERGKNAGLLASDAPFTESQRAWLKGWMNDVYGTFKGHVVAARKDKLKKPIDEIAEGRVYTGQQALELGLVDKIGTMQDAVAFAAEKAGFKEFEYELRVVPEAKNFIEKLMEQSGQSDDENNKWIATGLPLRGATGASLFDLAMPYLQHLDPHRVAAIRQALDGLQLMGDEGVLMLTPVPSFK